MKSTRRGGVWALALVIAAGCTALGPEPEPSLARPGQVHPLHAGVIAEPIAPQSPTTQVQRFRIDDLPADHGYLPGRLVGLYAREEGDRDRVVGVAEVVRAGDHDVELAALWVDLRWQRLPLAAGEPPARRLGGVFGHLAAKPGEVTPSRLDIGALHGAQVGDLFVALSDDPVPRELGLLRVAAVAPEGARVTWIRGEAPAGARVRRVGHEFARPSTLRVLVPRLAGDRGAEAAAAVRAGLVVEAARLRGDAAELRVEAADAVIADAAAAAALARRPGVDVVVWGSATGQGEVVALRVGVEFADPRRREEQDAFAGPPRYEGRAQAGDAAALEAHARRLAPLLAGWIVHSELEARGGGSSARAALYFADALAADDAHIAAAARARLVSCRAAMGDWAGASRLSAAVERDGEVAGDEERALFGRLARARLAASAGALDHAESLARAAAARHAEVGAPRGSADAMAVVADAARQRREFAAAQAILEADVLPVYASAGARRAQASALAALAEIHGERGAVDEAITILETRVTPLLATLGETGARARVASERARWHFARGEGDLALTLLGTAEKALARSGDVAGRATALERLAELRDERGEGDEAQRLLEREVAPARARLGDLRGRAQATAALGVIHWERSELARARSLFQEWLAAADRLGDRRERALALRWQASVLHSRGRLADALELLQREVLPAFAGEDDRAERAAALTFIAYIEGNLGHNERSIRMLEDEALPLLTGPGDLRGRAEARTYLAEVFILEERFDEAARLLREVQSTFERLRNPDGVARARSVLGDLHHDRGQLDAALRYFREAAALHTGVRNVQGHSYVMGRIARIHELRGEYDAALQIYRNVESPICERNDDDLCRAGVLTSIAELLYDRGDHAEALRLIERELLPVVDRGGTEMQQAAARLLRAEAYRELGELRRARKLLGDDVMPRYRALGDEIGVALVRSEVADIDTMEGRADAAVTTLREVLSVFERHANQVNTFRTQVQLAEVLLWRKRGDDSRDAAALLQRALDTARALKADDIEYIQELARTHQVTLE